MIGKIKYDLEDIPKEIPRIKVMRDKISQMLFWTVREVRDFGPKKLFKTHRMIQDDMEKMVRSTEELYRMMQERGQDDIILNPIYKNWLNRKICQIVNACMIERINNLLKNGEKAKALHIINSYKKYEFDILMIAFCLESEYQTNTEKHRRAMEKNERP